MVNEMASRWQLTVLTPIVHTMLVCVFSTILFPWVAFRCAHKFVRSVFHRADLAPDSSGSRIRTLAFRRTKPTCNRYTKPECLGAAGDRAHVTRETAARFTARRHVVSIEIEMVVM